MLIIASNGALTGHFFLFHLLQLMQSNGSRIPPFNSIQHDNIIYTTAVLQLLKGQLSQPHTTKTNHSDGTTHAANTIQSSSHNFL